jgi:hypothetical protein
MSEPNSDILELRRTVYALSHRVGLLEQRMGMAPEVSKPPVDAPKASCEVPVEVPKAAVELPKPRVDLPAAKAAVEFTYARMPVAEPHGESGREEPHEADDEQTEYSETHPGLNLEQWFGLYGLSRIGIASLVLGLALLILHSWDNFGPALKIAFGMFSGIALIGAGEWLSRKDRLEWYGLGIVGGGYSVCYFTTYAMQNIASVQIINNPLLDSCLLFGVAAVAMFHSVRKRSEVVALLSTILAFWTISLSEINLFSVAAAALLTGGVAWVVLRMRWNNVLALSTVASYVTFLLFTQPNINAAGDLLPAEAFWISAGILAVYWVGYNTVLLLLPRDESDAGKLYTLGVAVLNAAGFQLLVMNEMHSVFPQWRWLFLAGLGAYYLLASRIFSRREQHSISTVFTFVGLQGVTAAIPLRLDREAISSAWFLEIALLSWLGVDMKRPSFRLFGALLTGLVWLRFLTFDLGHDFMTSFFGLPIADYRLMVGSIGIAALGSVAYVYGKYRHTLLEFERGFAYQFYFWVASSLAWHLVAAIVAPNMVPVYFAGIGLAMAVLGMRVDKFIQFVAATFLANAYLGILWVAHDAPLFNVLSVLAMFFLTAALFNTNKSLEPMWRRASYQLYFFSATTLTWLVTAIRVDEQLAPFAVAIVSFGVLLLGMHNAEKPMRHLACLGFIGSACGLFANVWHWNWSNTLPVIAIIYLASFAYRYIQLREREAQTALDNMIESNSSDEKQFFMNTYGVLANILLTVVFANNLHAQWLTAGWALEGILLVGLGLSMWDKMFRISGLAVFALLVGKLLLVDLSGADTVGRIAGFIVAGIVLLIASYAYNWFVRKVEANSPV